MLSYFKQRRARKIKAKDIYQLCVEKSRQPVFYEQYGVPDNVDGRFEMIALHCYITMRQLQETGDKKLSQALFDVFFVSMDRSLREMGVGDLSVPKHMKRMMQGFNGRAHHYEQALQTQSHEDLKQALRKNLFGTVENPHNNHIDKMVSYVLEQINNQEGQIPEGQIKGSKNA